MLLNTDTSTYSNHDCDPQERYSASWTPETVIRPSAVERWLSACFSILFSTLLILKACSVSTTGLLECRMRMFTWRVYTVRFLLRITFTVVANSPFHAVHFSLSFRLERIWYLPSLISSSLFVCPGNERHDSIQRLDNVKVNTVDSRYRWPRRRAPRPTEGRIQHRQLRPRRTYEAKRQHAILPGLWPARRNTAFSHPIQRLPQALFPLPIRRLPTTSRRLPNALKRFATSRRLSHAIWRLSPHAGALNWSTGGSPSDEGFPPPTGGLTGSPTEVRVSVDGADSVINAQ